MFVSRFVFFDASTKCHVGVVGDRRDALKRTRADSVCDACVCQCIMNFPWTSVTSVRLGEKHCFSPFQLIFAIAACTRISSLFTAPIFLNHILVVLHFPRGSLCWSSLRIWFIVLAFKSAAVCLYLRACIVRVSIAILWHAVLMRSFLLQLFQLSIFQMSFVSPKIPCNIIDPKSWLC